MEKPIVNKRLRCLDILISSYMHLYGMLNILTPQKSILRQPLFII